MKLVSACLCLVIGAVGFAQTQTTVIRNVRIEVGDGTVVERGDLVLRDGKIVSIGQAAVIPPGTVTIEGAGLTAYPGFIDGFNTRNVTMPPAPAPGTPPESRTVAPPTTWDGNRKGIRAEVKTAACYKADSFTDPYRQGLVAAQVGTGSGLIRGTSTVVAYRTKSPILVEQFGMEIGWRVNGSGGSSQGYPGGLMGSVALLRQTLWDARLSAARGTSKDPVYAALAPAASGSMRVVADADTDREWARARNLQQEFGFPLVLKNGKDMPLSARELKAAGVPMLLRIDITDEPPIANKPDADVDGPPNATLVDRHAAWVVRSEAAKRLAEAGVTFAFSSDGDSIDSFLTNVRKTIKAGLSRTAALRALTIDAAAILGIGDRYGKLEAGKVASFSLMTGDFAKDGTKVQMMFIDGERVDVEKGGAQ